MGVKKIFNNYEICNDVTKIFLHNKKDGEFISLIDTKNLQKLIDLNQHWHLEWNKYINFYYVSATVFQGIVHGKRKYKTLRLHDFLLNTDFGQRIDHINHNTLDNRESNIRQITVSYNAMHRKGININNTSGYRNVCLINNEWVVQLQVNGKNKRLKRFPLSQLEEAGLYAEEMRKEHYGNYAGN